MSGQLTKGLIINQFYLIFREDRKMKKVLGIVVICLFLATALTVNAGIAPAPVESYTNLPCTLTGVLADCVTDPMPVRATIAGRNVVVDLPVCLYCSVVTLISTGQPCLIDITVDYDQWGINSITVDRLVVGIAP